MQTSSHTSPKGRRAAKTQVDLLNLHLAEFVFQMKSVNHSGVRRNCRRGRFGAARRSLGSIGGGAKLSAGSKLLHINLFAAVLVTLIILAAILRAASGDGTDHSKVGTVAFQEDNPADQIFSFLSPCWCHDYIQ